MTSHTTLALTLVTVAALTGCKKKDKPEGKAEPTVAEGSGTGEASGTAPVTAKDAAPATPDAAPKPAAAKGRKAEGNDPKLLELAEAAATGCTLDPAYPQNACRDQITPGAAAFDPDNAAHVATILNLLEDESPQVRVFALGVMNDKYLMQKPAGRAAGLRVAAAAAAETDATASGLWGLVLLQGDFADKGYADAVAKIATDHAVSQMRASVVSNLAVQEPARFVPFLQERYTAETDHAVKKSILGSFYTIAQADLLCHWLLQQFVGEPDNELAGAIAYNIVWTDGRCSSGYDSFTAAYAERVQTIAPDFAFVLNTAYMVEAKNATPEQHKAMCDAAKLVVDNKAVEGMAHDKMAEAVEKHCK
jgi:hypothetical protein